MAHAHCPTHATATLDTKARPAQSVCHILSPCATVPHEMKLCATPASTAIAWHPESARAMRDGLVLAAIFVRWMSSFMLVLTSISHLQPRLSLWQLHCAPNVHVL